MKVYLEKWQVKNLRDYFGENDKTQTEHWAFKVFDDALKNKQCIIDGVSNCKTPKKVLVLGCGDSQKTVVNKLIHEGFNTETLPLIHASEIGQTTTSEPLTTEPLTFKITETHLPNFNKPQNRSERRKQAKTKGKKKKR
ncbi:hypothetical protein [Thalassobellus suaedae]|uniref:Uncharacterized protein n=1 Tax=Thalassobellus suaedae TaxID=3074124 RepID=A0ABY9XVW3_9FLAO|nr:hypothetical protein RHP51_05190 [Flavobacteriaceae bacterium HL-DH14]